MTMKCCVYTIYTHIDIADGYVNMSRERRRKEKRQMLRLLAAWCVHFWGKAFSSSTLFVQTTPTMLKQSNHEGPPPPPWGPGGEEKMISTINNQNTERHSKIDKTNTKNMRLGFHRDVSFVTKRFHGRYAHVGSRVSRKQQTNNKLRKRTISRKTAQTRRHMKVYIYTQYIYK